MRKQKKTIYCVILFLHTMMVYLWHYYHVFFNRLTENRFLHSHDVNGINNREQKMKTEIQKVHHEICKETVQCDHSWQG